MSDGGAQRGLVNLLVVLADNKWSLGRHLSEWAVGAPVLETGVATAAIAQGHMGQARVLYPLLEELGSTLGSADERTRRYQVAALDHPFPTWAHVVAALLAVDGALNSLLLSLRGSSHEQLARRVGRMLEEERFQRDFAEGRVHELSAFPPGTAQLQAALDAVLPEMLCWFGPAGEEGVAALAAAGLLDGDGDRWRQRYLDRVGPVLLEIGVDLPARRAGSTWEIDDLPWDRWNPLQRRLASPSPAPGAALPTSSA